MELVFFFHFICTHLSYLKKFLYVYSFEIQECLKDVHYLCCIMYAPERKYFCQIEVLKIWICIHFIAIWPWCRPHRRKHCFQQFRSCVLIRCCRRVFIIPLSSNGLHILFPPSSLQPSCHSTIHFIITKQRASVKKTAIN